MIECQKEPSERFDFWLASPTDTHTLDLLYTSNGSQSDKSVKWPRVGVPVPPRPI